MKSNKRKPSRSVKATKIQLRLRPEQKALLVRAAELKQTSLSDFLLEHACEAAQHVLADQVDVVMSAADWQAFCKALDAPPRSIPALTSLLTRPSVLDGPGKTAAQ